uniref:Uncharacterized protein n=1 Tax=Megaselia scalaris TaxID=36166 RepID=T1GIS6_MEGSC
MKVANINISKIEPNRSPFHLIVDSLAKQGPLATPFVQSSRNIRFLLNNYRNYIASFWKVVVCDFMSHFWATNI